MNFEFLGNFPWNSAYTNGKTITDHKSNCSVSACLGLLWFLLVLVCVFLALWATRQTEETKTNRELYVKTTLRELIIYIVFLIVICVSK